MLTRLLPFLPKPPVVPVLRLDGTISAASSLRGRLNLASFTGLIDRACRMRGMSALALQVNSPGGSPVQSALIARRIRTRAKECDVPIFAFVEDVAASGGYWLACAGSEIFVHEASIVGSIGVIFAGFGFDGALARLGVERRVHALGARKGMMDPFRPEKPEDVATIRAMQEDIHDAFIEWVRTRRGARLRQEETDLFSGEAWTGRRAVALGLADSAGEMNRVLRERFGERVRLRMALRRRRRFPMPPGLPGLADTLEERLLWARYGV